MFVPPDILRNVFNSMAFGVCGLVAALWFLPMMEELRRRGKEAPAGAWVIVLGIFYWSLTLTWQRVFSMVSLYLGRPLWLMDGPIAAFVPFSIMWGGFLFLSALSMHKPISVPSRLSLVYILAAIFIGGVTAGFIGAKTLPF